MIPPDHRYSYSQISSFSECPFNYYLGHIEDPKPEQATNAWAEQGTLIHELLDQWAKGELTKSELPEEYKKRYPEYVKTAFPRMLASKGYAQKSYEQGLEYFENFLGFPEYEVVSAEEEFAIPIKLTDGTTRPFLAFVDLVLRDRNGGLVVCDHKSKSKTTFKREREEMYRQQYIYSYFVHEKYDEWPTMLMFNLFKENGYIDEQEFSQKKFEETMQWATDAIHKIESYDLLDWMECKPLPKSGRPDLFCTDICSNRHSCPQSVYKGDKK